MSEHLLEVSGLRTHFPTEDGLVRAVDGVDLHVDPGETLGIVGESGSGKSMTVLSIMRLLPRPGRIVAGSVRYRGRELVTASEQEMQEVREPRTGEPMSESEAPADCFVSVVGLGVGVVGLSASASLPPRRRRVLPWGDAGE